MVVSVLNPIIRGQFTKIQDPQHYCYCGFTKDVDKEECFYCCQNLMPAIEKSVADRRPTKVCLKYTS